MYISMDIRFEWSHEVYSARETNITAPFASLIFLCVEPLLACVSKAGLAIRFNVSSFDFAVEIENPSSNTLKHTDPQQSHATYCARILVFLAIIYQMNIWVRFCLENPIWGLGVYFTPRVFLGVEKRPRVFLDGKKRPRVFLGAKKRPMGPPGCFLKQLKRSAVFRW